MFSAAIIIFREMIEIAMILGAVMAATRGLRNRTFWVLLGLSGGLLGAGIVALFAESISNALSGFGQEFFNALILFVAAGFIGWTVIWMRSHARELALRLKHVGHDVASGKLPLYSLSLIIGLALLREGSEIVLFIYGMSLSGQSAGSIVMGSLIGVALGTVAGAMFYHGLLRLPTKYLLTVTSWLLLLLVAGLAAQGVGYLTAAGYFPNWSAQMWDSSWLLSDNSILGKALHSLIGYTAHPTAIQLIAYLGTLGGLLSIIAGMDHPKKLPTGAAA